ncbi:unnamed protein product [Cyberlindnera jadinii]|uniref:Nitrogen catabolite repression transcriptional regulator n=1 Tax=Cyberlindnera jadinii (strain ATCC 18201 / CBS 1600 / BCRC 20928 / JCM 3617 / NBRC 0987 / NRRL Y-1542) TaxID=983966 RepID=A0A0H5C6A7_CYBJN|nr:nitrogen catabolite repression transcriptional regulator [Cyberlindnera jadinii NRRL Y-1542]ODV73764.1 nitrogen catabolite repression transcriptional regulator [Cyberlindnera jadinii NRRL Y-1542]CEP23372.1 unnamed protein product [Cyberlindnera jadinii]
MALEEIEGDPHSTQLQPPYLKVYTGPTPNGFKITTLLKLLNVEFQRREMDMGKGEHKQPWYLKIHPDGRVPAISDVDVDGNRTVLFESAIILEYLADKYDTERKYSYDKSSPLYWKQMEWLVYGSANNDPVQGAAFFHILVLKTDPPGGKDAYVQQTNRILKVYNDRLVENNGWFVGDHLNIADIGIIAFLKVSVESLGIKLDAFPAVADWMKRVTDISGVGESISGA